MDSGHALLHYRLVEKIGAGAMGVVWKALDTTLDRHVALKILPESLSKNADRLARFEREAKLLGSLNHPNIATLYGLHHDGEVHFLTMELVEGNDLEERLRSGALSLEDGLDVCGQVADALALTHARGVIHRDLKPANIVVGHDGNVKVLDFGLAKALEPTPINAADSASPTLASDGTQAGVIMGTPAYMSPEQARGQSLDERTDTWSFGCILFEVLSGKKVFGKGSASDSLAALLTVEPGWNALPTGLPSGLVSLLQRCLEKDQAKRLRDIGEVRQAIEAARQGSLPETPPSTSDNDDKSIAVLPFANRSADPDNEFFSDGLSEELITALARLPGLRVAARTSTFRYRDSDADIRQIARELGVVSVLEGSVRRSGSRLRITAQLINASDGYQLWSERFDREMADVFEIQDEITEAIVKTLEPTLTGRTPAVSRRHTVSHESYELYLKGRHFWHQRTESSLRTAIDCFKRASELDPSYALAHAGQADAYASLRPFGFISSAEGSAVAEQAARRAMELDPNLAESHFAAALVQLHYSRPWRDAEPMFQKAIELNPSFGMAAAYYGFFLSCAGRFEEGVAQARNATRVEPLSPFVHGLNGLTFLNAGRLEQAIEHAERALALHPDFALGLAGVGFGASRLGQHRRALESLERLALISNRAASFITQLGVVKATTGEREQVLTILEELETRRKEEYVSPAYDFILQVALGNRETYDELMQACIEDGAVPAMLITYLSHETLDELAEEPLFADQLRKLDLID